MGINNLLSYIREKHRKAVLYLPLKIFAGKRLSIDISGTMFKTMCSCRKEAVLHMDLEKGYDEELVRKLWFERIVNIFCNLLDNGILPVIVFDGKTPQMKAKERVARVEKFRKKREEINLATEALRNCDPLDKQEMLDNLRKAYRNDTTISPQDHELIKIFLNGIGLPCLQAILEADCLVSSLCLYNEVAASFSIDSDILTHGSPLLITEILPYEKQKKMGLEERSFTCYHLGYLLESLDMSMASFVDFCILVGCDYNRDEQRIKGLGIVTAERLIKKYKYIEDIPLFELEKITKGADVDISGYRHIESRIEFSHSPLNELILEFLQEEQKDDDSDEEYIDEPQQDHKIGGLKPLIKANPNEKYETANTFGNRRDRYQLVSNTDLNYVFSLVNITHMVDKMRSSIFGYLEKYDDSGEPGSIENTWYPDKHIWKENGDLYINGDLFESFKD